MTSQRKALSRRTMLQIMGIGAGAVVVTGAGGVGVRGLFNGGFNRGRGAPYELWDGWASLTGVEKVATAGVLASNPHNTQPWFIDIATPDGPSDAQSAVIDIRSDETRLMPKTDASAREHFAGLGCAAENMVIAALAQGRQAEVTWLPSPGVAARVVVGTTVSQRPSEVELAEAIPRRHTDRGPFAAQAVDLQQLEALSEGSAISPTAEIVWLTEPDVVRDFGRLLVDATRTIIANDAVSTEAFAWFRNDRTEIDRHRDGLTLDCQGLDDVTLFAAKVLPASSRHDGDQFWLKSTQDVHTATAAAYGVVVVDDVTDRRSQLAGGRILERVHVAATSTGLALHHMNQVTECIDRESAPDGEYASRWEQTTGIAAGRGLLAFRVGYSTRAAGLSPRRAVRDVVSVPA